MSETYGVHIGANGNMTLEALPSNGRTLPWLQSLCGDIVQCVYLGDAMAGLEAELWCHEEGKLLRWAVNGRATNFFAHCHPNTPEVIVGDCLVLPPPDDEGATVGFSAEQALAIMGILNETPSDVQVTGARMALLAAFDYFEDEEATADIVEKFGALSFMLNGEALTSVPLIACLCISGHWQVRARKAMHGLLLPRIMDSLRARDELLALSHALSWQDELRKWLADFDAEGLSEFARGNFFSTRAALAYLAEEDSLEVFTLAYEATGPSRRKGDGLAHLVLKALLVEAKMGVDSREAVRDILATEATEELVEAFGKLAGRN